MFSSITVSEYNGIRLSGFQGIAVSNMGLALHSGQGSALPILVTACGWLTFYYVKCELTSGLALRSDKNG